MALDQNAGKKKAVGLARNLFPTQDNSAIINSTIESSNFNTASTSTTVSEAIQKSTSAYSGAQIVSTAKNLNRIKKVSFMIDPALEKRFRQARLKAGFEKLEDAYNEAMKKFCELVESDNLENKNW